MTESQPAQPAPAAQPGSPPQADPPAIIPPEMPAEPEWIERGDPKRLERREID